MSSIAANDKVDLGVAMERVQDTNRKHNKTRIRINRNRNRDRNMNRKESAHSVFRMFISSLS